MASLGTWKAFGLPFKAGIYQGYACLIKDYDDASTIFFWLGFLPLCVLIPLVYVLSCIIRIVRGGMLPPPGQRTTLWMYFSLIFVFVFMWLPFIIITFVYGPASPTDDSTWVLWTGAQFSHFQGLATVWTILFKKDIRAAFCGTVTCGRYMGKIWLLDSKLEESDRYQSIIQEWVSNPSSKLTYVSEDKEKKKYGRAAYYEQKQKDKNVINAQYEREKSRYNKDCKLLIETEKQLPSNQSINIHDIESLDPILPSQVLDTDPSSQRLLKEIVAATSSTNNKDDDDEASHEQQVQKATEVVRELCHRTSEACKEIKHMEQRLGKYQKFADSTSIRSGNNSKKKKRKKGSSDNDKVRIEWHNEDQLCSLIYVPKKRKSSRPSSQTGGFRNVVSEETTSTDKQEDDTATTSHTKQPKPFVVKINATHYHKLRAMFDTTYNGSSMSTDQATHAYHAILFAMVIRYSSLSGGQQLNDFRGGGMQGAIHESVFDVLSKWLGKSGTECFASPFNSSMSRFFSAFPSPDIDGHFGSHGDFFFPSSFDIQDGAWYELNPPFSPGLMDKMSTRISELLEKQCNKDNDVTFVVIIPTVRSAYEKKSKKKHKKKKKHKQANDKEGDESNNNSTHLMSTVNQAASESFNRLVNSPYCKSHIILPPREHGYIEGSQHLRPTKYKESQYSTSVIILSTKSKSFSSEDKKLFETEIREAFGSRHSMEVQQRKATKG